MAVTSTSVLTQAILDLCRQRAPVFDRGGDVQDDHLVDAFFVVSRGELRRIASVPQTFEVNAFHDLAIAYVETGDDALRQH